MDNLKELEQRQKEVLGKAEVTLKTLEGAAETLKTLPGHQRAAEERMGKIETALADVKTGGAEAIKKLEESLSAKRSGRKLQFGEDREDNGHEFNMKMSMSEFKEVFSLSRLLRYKITGADVLCQAEKLALGEGTGSAGGFLVPEEFSRDLRDRVTAQSVVRRGMKPTIYPMASDVLNVPKITGGATATWLAENAQITATDPTFGQLQLVAKLLGAMVKVSNQLIADSNPKVEDAIRRDTAKVIALAEDIAFIAGSGASNQPTGVLNTSGIGEVTLGANGGTPSFDTIYDALYEVEKGNGVASFWLMHPRTKNTLRKIKDTTGQYIYVVNPSVKEPDTLVGLPVFLTTQIPINLVVGSSSDTSYILVGQGDEAVIGERAGIEIAADQSGTAFEYYQTWIRAIERVDFGLRTPGVFAKVTGVRP